MKTYPSDSSLCIGIISDTHGYLSTSAKQALVKADIILHAGDINTPDILNRLRNMTKVIAVRGNIDRPNIFSHLKKTEMVTICEKVFYIIHNLAEMDIDPKSLGIHVVVHGHTHLAAVEERSGILYLNPGSASFPRGGYAPSIALIQNANRDLTPQFFSLE